MIKGLLLGSQQSSTEMVFVWEQQQFLDLQEPWNRDIPGGSTSLPDLDTLGALRYFLRKNVLIHNTFVAVLTHPGTLSKPGQR